MKYVNFGFSKLLLKTVRISCLEAFCQGLTDQFFIGLIYRHYRPVYYSPASRSALAEAELIYVDNHTSRCVYVSYECKLDGLSDHFRDIIATHSPHLMVKLLVWTTTPWTLPTNMVRIRCFVSISVISILSSGNCGSL